MRRFFWTLFRALLVTGTLGLILLLIWSIWMFLLMSLGNPLAGYIFFTLILTALLMGIIYCNDEDSIP